MDTAFKSTRLSKTIGGQEIIMETGRLANQADGAIWVQCGGTVVLVTVVTQKNAARRGLLSPHRGLR